MKKLFLLLFLLTAMITHARQISESEAASIASEFFGSTTAIQNVSKSGVRRVPGRSAGNADNAPFYVFNATDNKGFVIISGDDRARKILGYSDKGNFDFENLPPQLADLLEQYAAQISAIPSAAPVAPSWSTPLRASSKSDGVLLETANWGQGTPYNSQCPIIGGVRAPTGCVATAMAIVMKYNEWPQKYNWSSMPVENITESVMGDLPTLMKDAGDAVYMEYGSNESGADMNWVGHRLQQTFKYSPECQYITAKNFSAEEWEQMLRENLDKQQPVIYNGTGHGTHAFIIDGYNADLYHINWGWNGTCNGYFMLNDLSPDAWHNFSSKSGMVINISPDRSGKEYSECFCDYGYFWSLGGHFVAMNAGVEQIKTGEPFDFINTLINLPPGFSGLIGLALVSENDEIKQVVGPVRYNTWDFSENKYITVGTSYENSGLTFTVPIERTDRIQLVSLADTEKDYKLILGTKEFISSKSVTDIAPEYSRVHLTVGEGLKSEIFITPGNKEWIDVTDNQVLDLLKGCYVDIRITSGDKMPDGIINLEVSSGYVYGERPNVSKENRLDYGISLYDNDYEITAEYKQYTNKEIFLSEAGSLNQRIAEKEAASIVNLKISGEMNALDFFYLRDNLSSLQSLDLADVAIVKVEVEDNLITGMKKLYSADAIPEWGLTRMLNLRNLT